MKSVGLIPDGHRRWARANAAEIEEAWQLGFSRMVDALIYLKDTWQTTDISIFATSSKNLLRRDEEEVRKMVDAQFRLLLITIPEFRANGFRIRFVGAIDRLPEPAMQTITNIEEMTREGQVNIHILMNYSPSWDLLSGLENLKTRRIPELDLIIRSGGQPRLSGFLPFQSAESNIVFESKFWPDVSIKDIAEAIRKAGETPRTFGA